MALGGSADAGIPVPPPPGDALPTWSPDASAIVFASTRVPSTLRVIGPDGQGERPIPVPSTTYAFSPDWYWIAFVWDSRIVVMRPDGSQRHVVGLATYGTEPSWSPDGSHLTFQGPDGIYVAAADASELRRVAIGAFPQWSPRDDRIAYVALSPPSVQVVLADGNGPRQAVAPGRVTPGRIRWSPDATRISFYTPAGQDRPLDLAVVSLGSGEISRYPVIGDVGDYAWSPNRDVIALGGGIRLLHLDTGEVQRVIGFGVSPAWSPDGDQLALIPDSLVGTKLADLIVGLAGDDRLRGVGFDFVGDTLEGDEGNDVLVGTPNPDTLEGGPGADVLNGGPNHDVLWGGPGRDVLRGEGGNDLIDGRDGERDVISCGTNASNTTAPQGEADMAYVDESDAVNEDCEYVWYVGAVPPPKGRISLKIRVIPNGARPKVGRRSFTLTCRPAGGTLPHRAAACSKLLRVQNPFAPVPRDQACTQIYGGPQEAVVSGVYGGKPVRTTFRRTDGCQIARWNRVRFLFPIRVGIT